jgi:hypothetical protein
MGDTPETMPPKSCLVGKVIFPPYRAGYLGQSILPGFRCGPSPTLHPGLTNVPLSGATNRYPFPLCYRDSPNEILQNPLELQALATWDLG